jgi:Mg2+ and Co2+ transporter CorA
MNFDDLPLLHDPRGFIFFCVACVGSIGGMLFWFRRRGWI